MKTIFAFFAFLIVAAPAIAQREYMGDDPARRSFGFGHAKPGSTPEKSVHNRLEFQFNDKYDKAIFNKQNGPSIKILELGKPFDLSECEIDGNARTCRDTMHDEVWALMKADAKRAGALEPRAGNVSIRDTASTEWTPVGIAGKGIRVRYAFIRGGDDKKHYLGETRRLIGIANPVNDRTFLMDKKNVIFAEFDSEHLRIQDEPAAIDQNKSPLADESKSKFGKPVPADWRKSFSFPDAIPGLGSDK